MAEKGSRSIAQLQTGFQSNPSSPSGHEKRLFNTAPWGTYCLRSSPIQSSLEGSGNFTDCHFGLSFQLRLCIFTQPCSPGSHKAENSVKIQNIFHPMIP